MKVDHQSRWTRWSYLSVKGGVEILRRVNGYHQHQQLLGCEMGCEESKLDATRPVIIIVVAFINFAELACFMWLVQRAVFVSPLSY